jgi:hypothetical protein
MVDDLIQVLSRLARSRDDQEVVSAAIRALDARYDVGRKISKEPGLREIIVQFMGRIYQTYGAIALLKGKRILDIACGSNTSKAPSFVFVDTPFGEQHIPIPHTEGYTVQFEPWFCRALLELGAEPVGLDFGDLEQESFEHYRVDLGQPGALDFLLDHSFDAVQDSRLFGSPEFTAQFPNRADRLKIAAEIWRQEQRVLKTTGIVIHSDAAALLR